MNNNFCCGNNNYCNSKSAVITTAYIFGRKTKWIKTAIPDREYNRVRRERSLRANWQTTTIQAKAKIPISSTEAKIPETHRQFWNMNAKCERTSLPAWISLFENQRGIGIFVRYPFCFSIIYFSLEIAWYLCYNRMCFIRIKIYDCKNSPYKSIL